MSKPELDPNIENAILVRRLGFTDGNLESPIDLNISLMKVITLKPLEWVNINLTPRKVKITNTGYTVIVSASWDQERPYITGGPLKGNYIFSQFHFHWGKDEMNGSEHTIDGASMPMELHAVFFNREYEKFNLALRRIDGIIVVVYFVKLRNDPNEFVQNILRHLSVIQAANSSVRLTPHNLTNIMKPFNQDYFLYWGSTKIRTSEPKILWIISREPIGVSVEQVPPFRALLNERGVPILSNVRELKERGGRSIFHVCPSGSTYASLLPLPRDLPSIKPSGTIQSTNDTVLSKVCIYYNDKVYLKYICVTDIVLYIYILFDI